MKFNWRLRESGQRSGDGSSKERVERIAYCSSHVFFLWKTEEEIPKLFHNKRAKIWGRILFKKRGMMWSKVLNNVRNHGESRRSWSFAKDRGICNMMDSVNRIPRFRSTYLSRGSASRLHIAVPGCQISQISFLLRFWMTFNIPFCFLGFSECIFSFIITFSSF